jgi:DNA-binding transcriptional LysR family regulator
MDQLTTMRSFISVTKTGSFRQAARGLGISGSLVSRHVAELERTLGVRLINRTTRTVSLTSAGVRYAKFAERIIDDMEREQHALSGMHDKPEGPLSIICHKWIGSREVVDAIMAFSTRYPKIHIRFEMDGMAQRPYDFVDQGFDVAFVARQVRERNLALDKIAEFDFVLCASPGYLGRAGQPSQLSELAVHDCIVNTDYQIWHLRDAGHDMHVKINDPVYAANTYITLRKAALADRGIALLPLSFIASDLAAGSLVQVLPDSEVANRVLYALHLPFNQCPARVQLFVDFLTDCFRRRRSVRVLPDLAPATQRAAAGASG